MLAKHFRDGYVAVTNGRHVLVPRDVREEAEKYAKDSLEEEDDSDEDNM